MIGVGVFFILALGFLAGFYGSAWLRRLRLQNFLDRSVPDHLVAAALGLLALLLGFTFSLALERFETRRVLIVQEANAIGTVWLRAQLLEEPHRAELARALRAYVQARIAWSYDDTAAASVEPTTALQNKIWQLIGNAVRHDSSALLSRAVMDAMNDSIDAASARLYGRATHIPERVFSVLVLYAVLSAVMLGYVQSAKGEPHRIASALILLLVTLAVVVILDVDRPLNGAIKVSQAPLEDLLRTMPETPPP
jgi:hypothetical protein